MDKHILLAAIAIIVFLVIAAVYYFMFYKKTNTNAVINGNPQNPGTGTKPYPISYLVQAIPYQWSLIAPHMCTLINNVCTLMAAYNQLNIGLGKDSKTFTSIGKYSGSSSIIAHVAPGSGNSDSYKDVNNVYNTSSAIVAKLTAAFVALNTNINNTYAASNASKVVAADISTTQGLFTTFVALLPTSTEITAYNSATTISSADITKWNPTLLSTQDSSSMYNIWLWLYAYYLMMNNTVGLESSENWKYGKGSAGSPASLGDGGWNDMVTVAANITANPTAVAGLTKFTSQCLSCNSSGVNSYTLLDYYNIMVSSTYNNAGTLDGWYTPIITDLGSSGPYAAMNDLFSNM